MTKARVNLNVRVPDTNYGLLSEGSNALAVQSVNRPNFSRDFGLSDVINRYEAQAAVMGDYAESDLERETESDAENDVENGVESEGDIEDSEIAWLAERALRMPNEDDPGLWLVRVYVGLYSDIPKSDIEQCRRTALRRKVSSSLKTV